MADTDPRVEAAKVLRRHVTSVRWARSLGITHLGAVYLDTCSCGWNSDRGDVSGTSSILRRAQHQADMLAAAGLLTTPDHDREIAARALREAADMVKARRDEIVARHARTVGYWEGVLDALDWEELDLRATADRIEAGEVGEHG